MKTEKKVELLLLLRKKKIDSRVVEKLNQFQSWKNFKFLKLKKLPMNGITRDISLPLTLEHQVSTRRSYILKNMQLSMYDLLAASGS